MLSFGADRVPIGRRVYLQGEEMRGWAKKSVTMNHEFPRKSVDSSRIEIEVHYPIILGL